MKPMLTETLPGRWTRRRRDLGVAVWVAFLAASAGTFVLFGVLDPEDIHSPLMEQFDIGRKLAYGIGFGFLFAISLLASWLAIFMVRSGPRRGHARGKGARGAPDIHDPTRDNPDLDLEEFK